MKTISFRTDEEGVKTIEEVTRIFNEERKLLNAQHGFPHKDLSQSDVIRSLIFMKYKQYEKEGYIK